MPLNLTAAHSFRVAKKPQARNPLLKRSSSSFSNYHRRKSIPRSDTKAEEPPDEDFLEDRLEDVGLVKTLATDLNLKDVVQSIQHILSHMFDSIPEGGGFNSTRIAEILNLRTTLPPTVTVPHLHAFALSPTATEREVSELARAGGLKRVSVAGRGVGGSNVGEGLVLTRDMVSILRDSQAIQQDLADKFQRDLESPSTISSLRSQAYTVEELRSLMRAGFLTNKSANQQASSVLLPFESFSSGSVISISSISKAASGSAAAIGGEDALYNAGGGGRFNNPSPARGRNDTIDTNGLQLSVPGTGQHIKLVLAARSHLVALVQKSRYQEIPLYLLQERWDGGISSDDAAAKAKRYRGEFAGVLPARTRKWKQFYGLSFSWVLAECLGAGLIELFETGSVGQAARIP